MSILERVRAAIVGDADFEVRRPRPFHAGVCPWCHRAWSQEDPDVTIFVDPETGKDVITHGCGWMLSSDTNPEDIR